MERIIKDKLDSYPVHVKEQILTLRQLIFSLAQEHNAGPVTESLKWGQLSYHVKSGSPIRIDWSSKRPSHYSIYFHCQTKLVATFRELFSSVLELHGDREIALPLAIPLPLNEIRQCIVLALTYKSIKHLPLLGK